MLKWSSEMCCFSWKKMSKTSGYGWAGSYNHHIASLQEIVSEQSKGNILSAWIQVFYELGGRWQQQLRLKRQKMLRIQGQSDLRQIVWSSPNFCSRQLQLSSYGVLGAEHFLQLSLGPKSDSFVEKTA